MWHAPPQTAAWRTIRQNALNQGTSCQVVGRPARLAAQCRCVSASSDLSTLNGSATEMTGSYSPANLSTNSFERVVLVAWNPSHFEVVAVLANEASRRRLVGVEGMDFRIVVDEFGIASRAETPNSRDFVPEPSPTPFGTEYQVFNILKMQGFCSSRRP